MAVPVPAAPHVQLSFKRREKKYLMSRNKYDALTDRLSEFMVPDKYGTTAVCSIYYDTPGYDLIVKSIEKPKYKEKFRLRSYGVPERNGTVFAEIKKKSDGIVYKRRVTAGYEDMMNFLERRVPLEGSEQIQREILWMMGRYDLRPAVMIAYDRLAMASRDDPEVRVTFDSNIRYRTEDLDLRHGDYGELLRSENFYIMEMKLSGGAPLWLAEILSELKIYPGSFSKYGTCYKEKIFPALAGGHI